MKKRIVYTLAVISAFAAFSGCTGMRTENDQQNTPSTSATPMIVTPNPDDGDVRDGDGIITDEDNGNYTSRPSSTPEMNVSPSPDADVTVSPDANGSGTPAGGRNK